MGNKTKIRANKKDPLRALLTDTAPYETPLIFSNDGLYQNLKSKKKVENIFHSEIVSKIFDSPLKPTKPYQYKINNGPSPSLRGMSLIHPRSQLSYADFYDEWGVLIAHYCRDSLTSIRSPTKVGSIYYADSGPDPLSRYRTNKVDTLQDDLASKYATSYFAYRGYRRLYQFINSHEYLRLEKKYPYLITMDVARCFDSIYTHSMSWATKHKEFAKKQTNRHSFGNNFDVLIQRSNYNETNGIPIGAEVSRIFAEIILDSIDRSVISRLERHGHIYNRDYVVRRYVDDYYIFSNSEETQEIVVSNFLDILSDYNFNINSSKTVASERPFFTKRSSAMLKLSDEISQFTKSVTLSRKEGSEGNCLYPVRIRMKSRAFSNFAKRVKGICADYDITYDKVSPYIISALFNTIVRLVSSYKSDSDGVEEYCYRDLFETLLESAFFFYSVAPEVSASYNLSKIIIISDRFFEKEMPLESPSIKRAIYEGAERLIKSDIYQAPNYIKNHVTLEKLNIFLALEEIGSAYLLPSGFISKHLIEGKELGYFEIVSLLYYIKNYSEYSGLKKQLYRQLGTLFGDLKEIEVSSEKLHLLLDILSCPYVNTAFRQKLLKKLRTAVGLPQLHTADDETDQADYFLNKNWFVNWDSVDLYNVIEKKELKMAY